MTTNATQLPQTREKADIVHDSFYRGLRVVVYRYPSSTNGSVHLIRTSSARDYTPITIKFTQYMHWNIVRHNLEQLLYVRHRNEKDHLQFKCGDNLHTTIACMQLGNVWSYILSHCKYCNHNPTQVYTYKNLPIINPTPPDLRQITAQEHFNSNNGSGVSTPPATPAPEQYNKKDWWHDTSVIGIDEDHVNFLLRNAALIRL